MIPTHRLDPALQEEFRQRLLEARMALLRTVAITDEELATLEPPEPGAAIEDAARGQGLAILSRLEGRERHALDEIFVALGKLVTDTYGVCEGCGGGVALARLRAMPTARYCLPCQTAREGA